MRARTVNLLIDLQKSGSNLTAIILCQTGLVAGTWVPTLPPALRWSLLIICLGYLTFAMAINLYFVPVIWKWMKHHRVAKVRTLRNTPLAFVAHEVLTQRYGPR